MQALRRWPYGAKGAVSRALDIAIDALEGREINPIPSARTKMAAKLRAARKALRRCGMIWP